MTGTATVSTDGVGNSVLKVVDTSGTGMEIVLMHGRYTIAQGAHVERGVTPIGTEDAIGNSGGIPHTHMTARRYGRALNFLAGDGVVTPPTPSGVFTLR